MKQLFDDYGLHYVTGPLPKQVGSAWAKVFRLSLPNKLALRLKRRRPARALPAPAILRTRPAARTPEPVAV